MDLGRTENNMDPYKCKVLLFVLFSFHTMIPIAIQLAEELINIFYLRKCTGHFYTKKKEAVFYKICFTCSVAATLY